MKQKVRWLISIEILSNLDIGENKILVCRNATGE